MAAGERGDGGDSEPDYRFTLANERTFLAWQRTALGVLAAGVAVAQFAPEFVVSGARHAIGVALAALAVLTAGGGLHRWRKVDRAIRRGRPLPPHGMLPLFGVGLALVALSVLVLMVARVAGG